MEELDETQIWGVGDKSFTGAQPRPFIDQLITCFLTTIAVGWLHQRPYGPLKLKILTFWPFTEKVCQVLP